MSSKECWQCPAHLKACFVPYLPVAHHMSCSYDLLDMSADVCFSGACGPCLMKAGIMHNHFPGDDAAIADPSPFLFPSKTAPAVCYDPPQCKPYICMRMLKSSSPAILMLRPSCRKGLARESLWKQFSLL